MQPCQWERMVRPMYEALESDLVLVGVDRDACKMWCVDGRKIFAQNGQRMSTGSCVVDEA